MLTLWIVRHGQTDWNVFRLVQGWTDIPLNTTGREQAIKLKDYITGIRFHKVFSSDLTRAYETAKILVGNNTSNIKTTQALRERCFGLAEGKPRRELETKFANSPPGSESKEDIILRGSQFLDFIAKEYPVGRYLCVAHGGLIRAILEYLDVKDIPTLTNTGVTVIEHLSEKWAVKCVNWHGHLDMERQPAFISEL